MQELGRDLNLNASTCTAVSWENLSNDVSCLVSLSARGMRGTRCHLNVKINVGINRAKYSSQGVRLRGPTSKMSKTLPGVHPGQVLEVQFRS